ncbi:hypothetical protein DICSQDRAFT_95047 [Dichomitus squalens LYAD-421 SS1]|uniref:F-box domain-containing protein n=1 Tax=Dichomitus squalens TaxID=114155 RepID=A0A4Q9QB55_9APHY|nr:uncharacterized protein DICSQDRAFT_95047 [Dichomitus squalens LYAD-421 SS1]EJF66550.1 hypothetical protein DICSQDRAFT_95047 [Dichomitus squalens LYAD-421 SS1]TBU64902.1 hypothetical protein BD310DRAFT_913624 [Dichomitus squalens]
MHFKHRLPVLVDDLVHVIIESDDHWWPRDFQRLALISSAWLTPVRKRLYATPSLRSFRACKLFARTLSENTTLLSYLRGLDLRPIADGRRLLDAEEMQSLRFILALKGLQAIAFGGDLAVSAERFIHVMVDTHAITTLHIDGYSSSDGHALSTVHRLPSLEWDDVVAFRFPHLRQLTLSNLALTIHPPTLERPSVMTRLTLSNVDIVDGFLPDLCSAAWDSLRVLKVVGKSAVDMDDHIISMLEACPGLEELHYAATDMSTQPSIFDEEAPTCPNLQILSVSGFDVNPQTLDAIARACPKLAELAILGRIIRIAPDEWTLYVQSAKLPCLRRLVTPAGTNLPPFTFWSPDQRGALQHACQSRGIQLGSGTVEIHSYALC